MWVIITDHANALTPGHIAAIQYLRPDERQRREHSHDHDSIPIRRVVGRRHD